VKEILMIVCSEGEEMFSIEISKNENL